MNKGVDKRSLEVAIAELDKALRAKRLEIAEIEKARADLMRLNGGNEIPIVPSFRPRKRLRRGYGKELAREAFERYGALSVPHLRENILKDKGIDLKDSSARRIVEQLVAEKSIRSREDGAYEPLPKEKVEEADGCPF